MFWRQIRSAPSSSSPSTTRLPGRCLASASPMQPEPAHKMCIRDRPYVKQKFYKGSSKARGSGIGLAVCDEIVHRHGGTLTIENAQGGGTVVTIWLPLKG